MPGAQPAYYQYSMLHPTPRDRVWVRSWVYPLYSLPLEIMWSGYSHWEPGQGYEWRKEKNRFYGMELVTGGNLIYCRRGREYLIPPGHVFLFYTAEPFSYRTGPAGFVTKRHVGFSGSCADAIAGSSRLWEVPFVQLDGRDGTIAVREIMKNINRAMGDGRSNRAADISALIYALIMEVSKSAQDPHLPASLIKSFSLIERSVQRFPSIDEIAGAMSLSVRQCNRIFLRYLDTTPVRYFLKRKMEYAQRLLQTGMSVKEAAYALGYDDPSAFSTQFKRVVGRSPKHFRERQ